MTAALPRVLTSFQSISLLIVACIAGCASPKVEVADSRPQVLYLHTEFLPYQQDADKDLSCRLNREIVRQALLGAARDGLGVQSCDETLEESPPDDAHIVHLMLTERCNRDGKWHVKLSKFAEGQTADVAKPVWEKTYDCDPAPTKIYADMMPKFEADSRGPLIEALKTAGLHAEKRPPISTPKERSESKQAKDPGDTKEQREQFAQDDEKDGNKAAPAESSAKV